VARHADHRDAPEPFGASCAFHELFGAEGGDVHQHRQRAVALEFDERSRRLAREQKIELRAVDRGLDRCLEFTSQVAEGDDTPVRIGHHTRLYEVREGGSNLHAICTRKVRETCRKHAPARLRACSMPHVT
jgi:hypothetical protein